MTFKQTVSMGLSYLLIGLYVGLGMQLATYLVPTKPMHIKIDVDAEQQQQRITDLEFV